MSMPEMALRFILNNKDVATIIPGMRKTRHVESNLLASAKGPLPAVLHAELRHYRWERNSHGMVAMKKSWPQTGEITQRRKGLGMDVRTGGELRGRVLASSFFAVLALFMTGRFYRELQLGCSAASRNRNFPH